MPEELRQNVTFAGNGSPAYGYLAIPEGGSGPGVVVIQEWWGLTDHIAGIADRLAGEGFVALAPDLFGGKVAHDADEAGQLVQDLPVEARGAGPGRRGGLPDRPTGGHQRDRRDDRVSAWAAGSC